MMSDVGVQLQYFHIYSLEFAQEKYMNGVLFNSYRDILLFWRDASKILNQRGKRFLGSGLLIPFNERYSKFKQKLDKNAQNIRHMAQALHVQQQANFNRTQEAQVRELGFALDRSSTRSVSPRPPSYEGPGPGKNSPPIHMCITNAQPPKHRATMKSADGSLAVEPRKLILNSTWTDIYQQGMSVHLNGFLKIRFLSTGCHQKRVRLCG